MLARAVFFSSCIPLYSHVLYGLTGIHLLIWIHSTTFHSLHFTSSFVGLMIYKLWKKLKENNLWCCSTQYQRKNLCPHYMCSRQCLLICSEDWFLGAHCFVLLMSFHQWRIPPMVFLFVWYTKEKNFELIYLVESGDEIGQCFMSFRTQTETFVIRNIQVFMKRNSRFFISEMLKYYLYI